jgi:uncharacterized protein YndB with AHSA1/START domain
VLSTLLEFDARAGDDVLDRAGDNHLTWLRERSNTLGDRDRNASDGDPFHPSGEFREVEPGVRLTYTFRWDPPHPDDRETVVTLSLEDRGANTELRLTQGDFSTKERYALHEAGWTESFERLGRLLLLNNGLGYLQEG